MPKINFTGVTDGYPALPEGDYEAQLEAWEWFEASKTSGEPYVKLTFALTDPEYAGRKMWRNLSAQPQSLWAMKRALVRLGADADDLADEVDLDDIMPELVGSECILVLDQYEYENEIRNNVKDIRSANVFV